MTIYTCSKCGESDLGMYGHYDSETDGFTCDKKKADKMIKRIFIILLLPVVVLLIILGMASEALSESCYKLLHHLTNFKDGL